ncbi:hypothetical protein HYH03_011072 [Edaphochlamys debaryana]|uniref:Uncharacterized protein n=1 Tax=Edaphochlamys debaryana TaxID=47281 RepID=A0A836BVA6_9CHLO|nr:hypothetical protein HYH03_011072 [Edaphochlamys debaryana]|eukprot:KAG2490436.1 hypothetical protein HYH03_011072 [Edaphochlamys debaryana]
MYTSGHVEILSNAVAALSTEELNASAQDMKQLLAGLAYPDFPCGRVQVHGDEVSDNMKTCSLARLVLTMFMDKLSMGCQLHSGIYSLWHAMTLDPDKSVANIARNAYDDPRAVTYMRMSDSELSPRARRSIQKLRALIATVVAAVNERSQSFEQIAARCPSGSTSKTSLGMDHAS